MVLDLTTREFVDKSLKFSNSKQNLEVVEIRQGQRVIYISSTTGHKVLWRLLFSYVDLAEIDRLTFSKIRFEIGRSSHV